MAFDSSLPRDDTTAAQPNHGARARDRIWINTPTTIDVEDNATERPLRHSVTLWDEIAPAPRTLCDAAFDDLPPEA
jgi:hypothetical protein